MNTEVNFKCEGIFSDSFDRFYVVTKFILPIVEDIMLLPINMDTYYNYLNVNLDKNRYPVQHLPNIKKIC